MKKLLDFLGINCWLHGHVWFYSDRKKKRACQRCPSFQQNVNGKWVKL